jgi:glycosyltransferase involved in cell wall biosynthesis
LPETLCHITTVHQPKDMRIFYKECVSLAKAGYDVKLIVVEKKNPTGLEALSELHDGITIIRVPCDYHSKLQRFWKAGKAAYKKALEINAGVYHFHDPEFLWFGYQLVRKGRKVIYDAHEDVPRQILGKAWIPFVMRKPLAFLFEKFENYFASKLTGIITVTELIAQRFQKINGNVTIVKNYPILSLLPEPGNYHEKKNQVCYIGDITRVRGIVEMVKSLGGTEVQLALGGRFSEPQLRDEVMQLSSWKNVVEYGFVDRQQATQILTESKIGFVLLHPIINYQDALPVKLFEFMAAGIPVIVSNLRLQKQIVEEAQCGMVVNPFDVQEVKAAIQYLLQHPETARQMGMNGRKAVEEKYNWNKEERKLVDFYKKLI